MDSAELRRELVELGASVERMRRWRDKATTEEARVERSYIVRAMENNLQQACWHMGEADRLRNKQARLQEHQEHSGQTWGEVFGDA
jgi:hypothetical protein